MAELEIRQVGRQWVLNVQSRAMNFTRQYYYSSERDAEAAKAATAEAFERREAALARSRGEEIPVPAPILDDEPVPEPETAESEVEEPAGDWTITDPGATDEENEELVAAEVEEANTGRSDDDAEDAAEVAEEPQPIDFDVSNSTVKGAVEWVEANPEYAASVLEAEQGGKARRSLIAALEKLVAADESE